MFQAVSTSVKLRNLAFTLSEYLEQTRVESLPINFE